MIEPISFKADPNKARRPTLDSFSQRMQTPKGFTRLDVYCANNPDRMITVHRDCGKWYCVFEREGVEIIDKKEVHVMGPPGFPDYIQLQIEHDPRKKTHIIEVLDGRISQALNAAGQRAYSRKRFEIELEHPFANFLYVEAD